MCRHNCIFCCTLHNILRCWHNCIWCQRNCIFFVAHYTIQCCLSIFSVNTIVSFCWTILYNTQYLVSTQLYRFLLKITQYNVAFLYLVLTQLYLFCSTLHNTMLSFYIWCRHNCTFFVGQKLWETGSHVTAQVRAAQHSPQFSRQERTSEGHTLALNFLVISLRRRSSRGPLGPWISCLNWCLTRWYLMTNCAI